MRKILQILLKDSMNKWIVGWMKIIIVWKKITKNVILLPIISPKIYWKSIASLNNNAKQDNKTVKESLKISKVKFISLNAKYKNKNKNVLPLKER